MGKSRKEEHESFLSWLFETIKIEDIQVLVVAGDIFDTGSPPNYALELYYNFLKKLSSIDGLYTVITTGNHDSIATLKTSKQLLEAFNVYVITSGENEEQIIPIYRDKKLKAIVCAVPFLRDGVVRKAISNSSIRDGDLALNQGIKQHYRELFDRAGDLQKGSSIPIIATGHLTTVGSRTSESERDIYIGGTLDIGGDFLGQYFDYVALGHLHTNQKVKSEHVRYSGSPIPLSFGEANQQKRINIISFENREIDVKELNIPLYRRLLVLKGSGIKVKRELKKIIDKKTWIEVHLKDDNPTYEHQAIREYADTLGLTILAIKIDKTEKRLTQKEIKVSSLEELTPLELFNKRLKMEELESVEFEEELLVKFREVVEGVMV
jgi:exonuclease SbcD